MRPTGIHGRPFVPFDNVLAEPGDENNGYCTHVSILFPTWHRPYLALYEVGPLKYTEHDFC
jgi:tyrosinase